MKPDTDRSRSGVAATPWRRASGSELLVLAVILALVNASMVTGGGSPAARYAYLPSLVEGGDWWRIVTHPFAHVSPYHLVLDASAFLLLYHGLREMSARRRIALFVGAVAGSLALAALFPSFAMAGLCGLSGAAHGLMAVSALVSVRASNRSERRMGWTLFALVAGKAVVEAATGQVLFAGWHVGNVGLPNPYCHLGGVLGGLAALAATFPRPRHLPLPGASAGSFGNQWLS